MGKRISGFALRIVRWGMLAGGATSRVEAAEVKAEEAQSGWLEALPCKFVSVH